MTTAGARRFAEIKRKKKKKKKKRSPLSRVRNGERFDCKAERWDVDARAANRACRDQGSF